ncbi:MAG TPA: hypothetical protein VLQ66_03450 [Paenisporosarcina sp.]|nr:hypothetical protein [Paenisporosarcina sp.]
MWKKTTMAFGLSALLLAGCNMGDDKIPTDETPMDDDANEVREDMQDVVPNGDVDPTEKDRNLDEDKDMMKDPNTEEEEILEDDMDARDADDKDQ